MKYFKDRKNGKENLIEIEYEGGQGCEIYRRGGGEKVAECFINTALIFLYFVPPL